MRYWLFDEDGKRASGPHLEKVLAGQRGFGPESLVAPAGTKDWKRAKDVPELRPFLPAPPPVAAPPAEKPK